MTDDEPVGEQPESTGRDEAGRFRPGNPYAWSKGVSGNPEGLGPLKASIRENIKRMLAEEDGTMAQRLARIHIRIGLGEITGRQVASQLKAIEGLTESVDGKVTQTVHNLNEELEIRLVDRPKAKRPDA